MPRTVPVAALVSFLVVAGCTKDVVLPDLAADVVCGNGVVEQGEVCDNQSPGCVDCAVAPGWICTNNVCTEICGDGVVGDGDTCQNPRRDTDCDMTGYWIASETDYTCDDIFHQPQTSSNWYVYHFTQTADSFQVDAELNCGVHVTGSATVDYTPAGLKAVLYLNSMDGSGSHPARIGTSTAAAGGCAVTLARWYQIRGGDDTFLPADFSTDAPLATLPSLPAISDPINGSDTLADAPGATDPDGDGFAGISFHVTGIIDGVRDSVQRDWKQYATTDTPVAAASLQFDVPGAFDLQEDILHVSSCGTGCGLLTTGAAASTAPGKVTFKFLGKTLTNSRVAAVIVGPPRQDPDTDLTTCANVQQLLPHEEDPPSDACPKSSN